MKFFLKTVLPIFLGVVLWNLLPGTAAKIIALGVAAVIIAVPILRGKYGGRDTRSRMTALMLTVAILSASTLPAPAQRSGDWSPQGENVVEVQRAEFACGFWCKVGWGLAISVGYDIIKSVLGWWIANVWDQDIRMGPCDEDGETNDLAAFFYGEGACSTDDSNG